MNINRISNKKVKESNLNIIGEKELNYLLNFWLSGLCPITTTTIIDWSITSSLLQFVLNFIEMKYN
jgi:hypothetical protein